MEMSEILSDKPATPAEPTPAPEPAVQVETKPQPEKVETESEAQARGRDASGKFTKAEPDKPAEPAKPAEPVKPEPVKAEPPTMTDKEKALLAAATDERRKRQDAERRLAEYEAAKSKEPAKNFYDDPDAALQTYKKEIEGTILKTKLDTTEAFARRQHPDFEEKVKVFGEIMQNTPGMYQHWIAAADPAEFAYRTAKEALDRAEWQKVGGVEGMRAQIEKETRIKLEAELKAREEALKKEREAIPGTLSNAAGTSSPNKAAWGGPPPMSEILKG